MPLCNDEIQKNVKKFEELLPEVERNPEVKEDLEQLIERAAKPLLTDTEKSDTDESYTEK